MAYLEMRDGDEGRRIELDKPALLIGRDRSCDVKFDDRTLSRRHATLVADGAHYVLEDCHSLRGTYVNGKRVRTATRLNDQDVITICRMDFVFHADAPEGEDSPLAKTLPPAAPALSYEEALEGSGTIILSTQDVGTKHTHARTESETKLWAVMEIVGLLRDTIDVDHLLETILASLFRIFKQANKGVILLFDAATGELVPRANRTRAGRTTEPVGQSQTIIRLALENRQAILSGDALKDELFEYSQSVSDLGIRSVMCAPLQPTSGPALGVLHIHAEEGAKPFRSEDLDILVAVANAITLALENASYQAQLVRQKRIERELELARDVQEHFLAASLPEIAGYGFAVEYKAAATVGGDYYGFVELPEDRLAVAIGDVSGKGMPAALLMARLSSDVRHALITTAGDPAAALEAVNRSLAEAHLDDRFVTLLLMILDKRAHTVTLSNAGHYYPILKTGTELRDLGRSASGLPLNVSLDPDYRYRCETADLPPGSTLFAFSDGVIDTRARDGEGEFYGLDRLRLRLRDAPATPRELAAAVLASLRAFSGGDALHDDRTMVCFGRI